MSDDDLDLLESMGLRVETTTPDMTKGWMQFHNFVLVSDISQVEAIVEDALAKGECSLDLETEGLDSRIYYRDPSEIKGPYEEYWEGDRPSKIMQTVHKVVGYCMSTDGHTGYYIPVRHTAEGSINLDPVAVGKLIKKLCMASQPTLTEEGFHKDPLGSSLIAEPGRVKIYFWNAKFDQEFLYPITGLDYWHPDSYEDGLLLYFARNTSDKNLSLKAKSKSDLHVKDAEGKPILGIVRPNPNNPIQETVELSSKGDRIPYEMIELKQLFGKGRDIKFAELHPQEGLRYGCSDGICTFLHMKDPGIVSMIKDKRYSFMYRLDKQTQQVCRIMERPRIMIDMDKVRELFTEARAEANLYREQIVSLAEQHGFHNFDPQSPQQVSEFFFSKPHGLCIEPKPEQNEKSGQYKTDADTLEKLVTENDEVNPILLTLVKYRQIEKVIGTYLENMIANVDSNNELRYQFKQVGAATTRFSAPAGQGDQGFGGVPIHGIPSGYDDKKPKVATRLRELFKARPGYAIVKIDFAGEELRIATNMSKEPVWINEFLHGTGDLHTITAQAFFNKVEVTKQERQGGKMANFSLIFGGGVGAIQRATQCNPQEAARRKANFDKALPKFAIWSKGQKAKAHKDKGIFTAFGRWMALPDIDSQEKFIVASVERQAVNYGIQGCLPKSTKLLTNYGYLTIGEVRKNKPADMKVWTGSNWAPFTIRAMGAWERATIDLTDGTTTQCDTRHIVLKVTEEGYFWTNWEELQPGDRIATPMAYPVNFKRGAKPLPEMPESLTPPPGWEEEFWYWIGRYYGDGLLGKPSAKYHKDSYKFTTIFGPTEFSDTEKCVQYWRQWGLNPHTYTNTKKDGTFRYRVVVCNKDFHQWLASAGFVGAIASTKRLADRVYCESLTNRKALIRGMMDSDGHKSPMFSASGELVCKAYNIHLCQKPLLLDFKLLFRTLGVESVVRGPYVSGKNKKGENTTSYRLDINRRMYERSIEGVKNRLPKFHELFAPQFMVDDFLSKVPKGVNSVTVSHKTMLSRLRNGGQVTVYTLQDMCEGYGVQLDNPLYSTSTVKSKRALGFEEETFSLSVKDPLHRYEAEGVIHKNTGADIMRMALVMTHKEAFKRGWYQRDEVRCLLTVHDEIVWEVKIELLEEVVPVLEHLMCEPARIIKWEVPLEAEPLVDLTWDAKYDFNLMTKGKPHKEGDKVKPGFFVAGSRQYQEPPDWFKPHFTPNWVKEGLTPGEVTKPEPKMEKKPEPLQVAKPAQQKAAAPRPTSEIFEYQILTTTANTVRQVWKACSGALEPSGGKILHLRDGKNAETLISPDLGVRVNPEEFMKILAEHNL